MSKPLTSEEGAVSHEEAVLDDRQILALAARLERELDYQETIMRLAEERRIERLKKRYRRRYQKIVISTPSQRELPFMNWAA